MTKNRKSRENPEVREFLLRNVEAHRHGITALAAARFGLSRNAINGYLDRLMAEGLLSAHGQTKARTYVLKNIAMQVHAASIVPGLTESDLWRQRVLPYTQDVPANVLGICQYGFTQMFANILNHSGSQKSLIKYRQTYTTVEITVADYGTGLFAQIAKTFGLPDSRSALLELSKGKLTSDKTKHAGEGIFFTSRMFDRFTITSGDLYYRQTRTDGGWRTETRDLAERTPGTIVRMSIATDAARSLNAAFEDCMAPDKGFCATHIPVTLGAYPGEQLVSRAQAQRILSRLDNFAQVVLDFQDVEDVGQAFADEIFRVFAAAHPHIRLIAGNANPQVERLIAQVKGGAVQG